MNILFVRNYPSVDGVFTLILRLAIKLRQDGHAPYYIDFGDTTDFELDIKKTFEVLDIKDIKSRKNLPLIDIIFPLADGELLYWCINYLKYELFNKAKLVIGVFNPRAYFDSTYMGPTPDTILQKFIFKNLPPQNILFMNETVKSSHENYFKIKFEESPVVPLPVRLNSKLRDLNKVNRKKIVSIGRLENFKRYVLPMIDTVEQLHDDGYDFEFYIYGHGQMEKSIKNYITERNVEQYVFLMGKLEYEKLYQVLEDTFMFVGMGTTIIEASSIGVPSLQAIDNENRTVTYGFFDRLNGFCVGEIIPELKLINMKDSIIELSKTNELEYQEISNLHIKRAYDFDIDVVIEEYYNFFTNASNVFNFKISYFKLIAAKLFRQLFKAKFLLRPEFKTK